jgi:ABC-type phosphate transport system auxiliary subunit
MWNKDSETQAICRSIRFNSFGKIKIFKIFSESEIYKLILNYKKFRINCQLINEKKINVLSSKIIELRLKEKKIEKDYKIQKNLLEGFQKNFFNLYTNELSENEKKIQEQFEKDDEIEFLKIKNNLKIN